MRKVFEERRRITVYVDEAEYKWVVLQAGGDGQVSSWAREILVSLMPSGEAGSVRDASARKPAVARKAARHKTATAIVMEEENNQVIMHHRKCDWRSCHPDCKVKK